MSQGKIIKKGKKPEENYIKNGGKGVKNASFWFKIKKNKSLKKGKGE